MEAGADCGEGGGYDCGVEGGNEQGELRWRRVSVRPNSVLCGDCGVGNLRIRLSGQGRFEVCCGGWVGRPQTVWRIQKA